ncbi:MAG TPA: DNA polymerase Y family protein, partial [Chloroflexota bacterium]|nr:DNA polymerase Y family protein [Chloroflexota bacterium]
LCSTEAEEAGIRPGVPLREVLPLCREAVILQPDPVRIAMVLQQVLVRLHDVTPSVELAEEELFLDLRGLDRVYQNQFEQKTLTLALSQGERGLVALERAIRVAVPALLQPRIGLAGGKFAASVAARQAEPKGLLVVPAEESAQFLAPLELRHLPFPPDALEYLNRLGLQTIGELAALPFSAVQAQFGRLGARVWRLAHGQDEEPVVPQPQQLIVQTALRAEDPLVSMETVLAGIDQLLIQAFASPLMRARSARQTRLAALLTDGASWERRFTFKEPLASRHAARRAIQAKLNAANNLPPAPVEELRLELLGLGPETARQPSLFGSRMKRLQQIAEGGRQLAVRYGQMPLYRPVEVEPWSRIPERRWALTPYEP